MKIVIRAIRANATEMHTLPDDWPLPRVGDVLEYEGYGYEVKDVIWYPEGDINAESPEPCIYVVARA